MSLGKALMRVSDLLLYPGREWTTIANEENSRRTIFLRFVFPLLCLIVVLFIIGSGLYASRFEYSFNYVVGHIATLLISLIGGLYLSSYIITEVMGRIAGSRNHDKTFALVAYSAGATYLVIAIVELFPFFKELTILGFYSCYLYWRGVPHIINILEQKRMIYCILSFIIMGIIYLLMFYFIGNIFKAIMP